MYQTRNPYTGVGTINLAPSEYSTLGLGANDIAPVVAPVAGWHSPNVGSPGVRETPVHPHAYWKSHPYKAAIARVKAHINNPPSSVVANPVGAPVSPGMPVPIVSTPMSGLGMLWQNRNGLKNKWQARALYGLGYSTPSGDLLDTGDTGTTVDLGGPFPSTGLVATSDSIATENTQASINADLQAQIQDIETGVSTIGSGLATSIGTTPSALQSTLNTTLADAQQLAKIVLTPGGSYTITNPVTGVTTSYQGTGAGSTGIPSSLSSVFTGASGSTILMLALAAGAIMLLSGLEKK